jgi:hypothetical protein
LLNIVSSRASSKPPSHADGFDFVTRWGPTPRRQDWRSLLASQTGRTKGLDGSVAAKSTGPIPQIAMIAGSLWLRITPS